MTKEEASGTAEQAVTAPSKTSDGSSVRDGLTARRLVHAMGLSSSLFSPRPHFAGVGVDHQMRCPGWDEIQTAATR